VIPANMMMTKSADEAIADAVDRFRKENAEPS